MLRELDTTISEPAMIARLVNQIDLLALIKVDYSARQIQVHRVVQTVVRERMSDEELEIARDDAHTAAGRRASQGRRGRPADVAGLPADLAAPAAVGGRALDPREQVRDLLHRPGALSPAARRPEPGLARAGTIEDAWMEMLAAEPDADSARPAAAQAALPAAVQRRRTSCATSGEFDGVPGTGRGGAARPGRELLGDEHPHTLQTRSSLAADLRALGEYQRGAGA